MKIEWLEVEPKERKMNKFKVGDYVSSKHFEGVKQISAIDTGANFFTIKVNGLWYSSNSLTLVCGWLYKRTRD